MMSKIGNNGLTTCDTETLAIPLPTNNMVPTGGVHKPIHKLSTKTIPKCTGCIPKASTTGKNIGVNIKTAGVISMKVPTINSTKLMTKNITILLLNCSNKKPLISSGIPSKENNQDIAIEVHIRNITTAVVLAAVKSIFGKSLVDISP